MLQKRWRSVLTFYFLLSWLYCVTVIYRALKWMNQWNYQILDVYKQVKLFVAALKFVKILPLLGWLCLISVLYIYSSLCPYPGSFRTKLSLNESSEQATAVVSHVTHDTQGGEFENVELVLLVLCYSTILLFFYSSIEGEFGNVSIFSATSLHQSGMRSNCGKWQRKSLILLLLTPRHAFLLSQDIQLQG